MSTALRAERNRAKPRFRQTTMKGSGKRSEEDRISSICDALRQAIIEQALKPGTKLPEDSLGECFGVGRTIARQALARLTAEGLVEHRRNKGPRLRPPVGKKQGTCSICALASNVLLSVGLPETSPLNRLLSSGSTLQRKRPPGMGARRFQFGSRLSSTQCW